MTLTSVTGSVIIGYLGRRLYMFINKAPDRRNNLCGSKVASLRIRMQISQRELADRLQIAGLDIDKNAVQRIEAGKRFVTDIELVVLSKVLNVSLNDLVQM